MFNIHFIKVLNFEIGSNENIIFYLIIKSKILLLCLKSKNTIIFSFRNKTDITPFDVLTKFIISLIYWSEKKTLTVIIDQGF